ncbi:MAG: endonuclease domain-containing protein [Xanthomonadales bacterium]|nr:endonuclease domain-containing protein [Xanthomonadales bacterium]
MTEHRRPPLPSAGLERARSLRRSLTDAERELWSPLRGARLGGYRFRRQHLDPPYVLDFYCRAAKLVVELDGGQHTEEADAARTRALEARGLRVIRFWNNDVLSNTETVLEAILSALQARPLTPTPLPSGEGLERDIQP